MEDLPEAVLKGHFKAVPARDKATFIAFDVETTDLGK